MHWDIGTVYKTIRKSKGITQQEICGDWISRSNLSKFESNQSVPSYETMEFLLHQIDMSFGEFEYICDYYKPRTRQVIINQMSNHLSTSDSTELIKIAQLCKEHLKKVEHDLPIQHILETLNIIIEIRKNSFSDHSRELAEAMWSDLKRRDIWYKNDFNMLGVILFIFPIETLQDITEKILINLEKYKDYKSIKNAQVSLLLNLSTIYLCNQLLDDCEHISAIALDLAKQLKRYDFLGFAQVRLGICQANDELTRKGLSLLELTEETKLLEDLQEEVKQYRASYFSHISHGISTTSIETEK
ncbi:helix-turn-helix transcriptional regulator [Streptococcus constellatus]|uniref:DNA-binding helix-turn-helix protein n=1 Tax=Streptococcus constellatus subsp. constellatus SK53 TaxID=1095730 RepID=A0AAD2Y465_STRCV|nr:helix-turn-helix transcriptional regulator [Streptococcus constellatus]EID19465.1 DNA-binding helix-turn-helix protein [Streptococcus constellatus subsp. constellatus SK53]MDP1485386.1 helix-turn-helix transcriptional regulator [Streptococcus constellatus]QQT05138.1 helix-turn-helix transcriptional regulator [Streptococcus constellatus]SUN41480.1 putative DNA-binding protein [Streptococcus constellatus]BBD23537.1 DNA-binding protein [Streptococcus constellatus subsp. constellatus]